MADNDVTDDQVNPVDFSNWPWTILQGVQGIPNPVQPPAISSLPYMIPYNDPAWQAANFMPVPPGNAPAQAANNAPLTTANLTPWQSPAPAAGAMPVSHAPAAAPVALPFANVPAAVQASPQGPGADPQVTYKPNLPAPSDQVQRLIDCIPTQTNAPFQISETSGNHASGDPHTDGLAMDVKAQAAYRAALMQAAANCGAVYQQDEYAHPSANAIGLGHLHFQMRPALHNSAGPYYPQIRPTARPSS